MADRLTIQPVTNFAACCWLGCKAPVQFLQIGSGAEPFLPLCREHGQDHAEAEAGKPVVWCEPLGFISAENPEPRA